MTTPFESFVEAVERDGARLKAVGSGFHAVGLPCPECGARDHEEWKSNSDGNRIRNELDRMRLSKFTDKDGRERGGWFCNKCEAKGDDVRYMMLAHGMSFYDAHVAIMGCPPPDRPMQRNRSNGSSRPQRPRKGDDQTETPERAGFQHAQEDRDLRIQRNPWPCMEWTARAAALCCELDPRRDGIGERHLAEAYKYIEEGRGIRLDVAPVLGVYWNPADKFEDPARWGLKRAKKLFIPRGIVIAMHRRFYPPWESSPYIVGLLVRRANPSGNDDKLRWVPFRDDDAGQDEPRIRTMLLGMTTAKGCPCIVMESALDAALAFQECGAEAAVISLNGADYPLDADCAEVLASASRIWAWPDADDKGMAAFRRWKKAFPSMELIEMPKDAEGKPLAKDATGLVPVCRTRPDTPTVRQILAGAGVVAHG